MQRNLSSKFVIAMNFVPFFHPSKFTSFLSFFLPLTLLLSSLFLSHFLPSFLFLFLSSSPSLSVLLSLSFEISPPSSSRQRTSLGPTNSEVSKTWGFSLCLLYALESYYLGTVMILLISFTNDTIN